MLPWLIGCLLALSAAPLGRTTPGETQARPKDTDGNPLPPGALRRLGSMRLRHPGGVRCLAFSPNDKLVASGGGDETVRVWDVVRGQLAFVLTGHRDNVQALGFSKDGKRLASVSADGGARVWDVEKHATVHTFQGRPSMASIVTVGLAPDGRFLAVGNNFSLRMWETATGKERPELIGAISALAFSPDGKRLAATTMPRGRIHIHDLDAGAWQPPFDGPRGCFALAFSEDGRRLRAGYSGTTGSGVSTWSATDGKRLEHRNVEEVEGISPIFSAIAVSPNGARFATAGGEQPLTVWDAATGKQQYQAQLTSDEYCLTFSASGDLVATGSMSGSIRLWDADSAKEIHPRLDPQGHIHALVFAHDGTHLFTGGSDQFITCWRLADGKPIRRLVGHREPVQFLAVGRDGKTLYSAGAWRQSPTRFHLWALDRFQKIEKTNAVTTEETDTTSAAALAPEGSMLAAAVFGKLFLWNATTLKEVGHVKADSLVRSFAIAPDGRILAFCEGDDLLRFWHVPSNLQIPPDRPPRQGDLARYPTFSPNGRLVAAFSPRKRAVLLFEANTGEQIGPVIREIDDVRQIVFAPDGRGLAMSTSDRVVRVWQLDTGAELYRFDAGEAVGPLAFSPDGKMLATAQTASVLVWDVSGRRGKYRPRLLKDKSIKIDQLWERLRSRDAARATEAIWDLTAMPDRAVPLLAKQLSPRVAPGPDQIQKWMKDLQHDRFVVREQAQAELAKLEEIAEPWLKKALADNPPLELRRRAEQLLKTLTTTLPTPNKLQAQRGIEALEMIGTPEARSVLERLAAGAVGSEVTRQAQAALDRLRFRE
jgi:WD40 repeat protein